MVSPKISHYHCKLSAAGGGPQGLDSLMGAVS
jgi:hypothetical protein